MSETNEISCSFCAKSRREVIKLVSNGNTCICNECIAVCRDRMRRLVENAASISSDPERGAVRFRCSLCNKGQNEVKAMITGGTAYICNECVDSCYTMIEDIYTRPSIESIPAPGSKRSSRKTHASKQPDQISLMNIVLNSENHDQSERLGALELITDQDLLYEAAVNLDTLTNAIDYRIGRVAMSMIKDPTTLLKAIRDCRNERILMGHTTRFIEIMIEQENYRGLEEVALNGYVSRARRSACGYIKNPDVLKTVKSKDSDADVRKQALEQLIDRCLAHRSDSDKDDSKKARENLKDLFLDGDEDVRKMVVEQKWFEEMLFPEGCEADVPSSSADHTNVQIGTIIMTKEYHVSSDHIADFENSFAITGVYGRLFAKYGCKSYALLRDKRKPRCYVVSHSWPDVSTFDKAQQMAAQDSFEFQKASHGWIEKVCDLSNEEAAAAYENNAYEILSFK